MTKAFVQGAAPVILTARSFFGVGLVAFSLALAGSTSNLSAQQPWPLWQAYVHHYLGDQGRVIDHSANDRTTSEGQAYALFFSLVDNDRPHFDKLLNWTEANLAQGDLTAHLPAWNWGKSTSGEWKIIDQNSASDADLWLAYTLLEAGRLWHEPRFESLGKTMALRIAKQEVVQIPSLGTTLAPGPSGFNVDPSHFVLNPSYLPLSPLARLAQALPQGPWGAILSSLTKLVAAEVGNGFVMDWVKAGPDGVQAALPPTEPTSGTRQSQPAGSYDAIRMYLWLGLADPQTAGRGALLKEVEGMAGYLHDALMPPLQVNAKGVVVEADGPVGFSAAVIPYLLASGARPQSDVQKERLKALRDPSTSLYGHPVEYYDQNLALFSTAWLEQRYRFERDGKLHVAWK